ncbi:MAG: UMP kinase [Elusimicrobia bacterium]|nr:UMP kinase [Elusimicrobiota bacterium]MBK7208402.1 UMP kinase [Elusimicrobiota bacterium]MBK7545162.1 UMP kinase [Elusimicrobiota bacterium]MBK7574683.1 UMP kinase [Elusimicrobiota bacterium]MBK7688743.1 UMP kinase [Elusimicrobiota bacterium]
MSAPKAVRRVVLKLSGEALLGRSANGIDVDALFSIAQSLKSAQKARHQVAVVVGGGNIWRGGRGRGRELDRVISDQMGMLATLVNALALQDALEKLGVPTRVMSAMEVAKVAEPYIRRRAIRHLEKGRLVIFAAGTGNPFFSTDTAAALRASEIEADIVLKATQVDGVYDADPHTHPKAKRYKTLSLNQALRDRLGVMDAAALALCLENKIPIRVFNLRDVGSIRRAIAGEAVGTLVTP